MKDSRRLARKGIYKLAFPNDLVLRPVSRWPTRLPEATIRCVLSKRMVLTKSSRQQNLRAPIRAASVVLVTMDNLVYNRLCLESLLANTDGPDYELIVVDNGSTDGTTDYLRILAQQQPNIRVIFNDHNVGFAAANNQGLRLAAGEVLVLLNNDTIVPHGWLRTLVRHLKDPAVGLIGPVTNRTCNEAQIETPYRTYGEFVRFARRHAKAHQGDCFKIRMLAMFCVALRRDVFAGVGPLDEQFGIGLFEDDDYAMRVLTAGYDVVCVEDVFVHHFGQATIGKLAATGAYGPLFHANRQRWETKWGRPWQPYRSRTNPDYIQLIGRIRKVVRSTVPAGAHVLVVNKGDEEILHLPGWNMMPFPQAENGGYAGHYPADSATALFHLETLRAAGAEFLIFPSTALWWLDYYTDFARHLQTRYPTVVLQDDACRIFALRG
jgi:GT2 family glycosyltransferase